MEDDEILGTLGNDNITGTDDDDRIIPFSGNDIIDGDDGDDTVVFFGSHADYIITQNPDGSWTLTDTEEAVDNQGSNTLTNIERVEFTRTTSFTLAELLSLQTTDAQTINGTASPDSLSGSLGDDTISAGDDDDSLYGGPGNDRLTSGRGNDFVNGGIDQDTLVLEGSITDFTITSLGNDGYTISDTRTGPNSQGTDTVYNVEQFEFTNGQSISVEDWLAGNAPTNIFNNVAGQVQFLTGTEAEEAFVINGRSTDFGWGATTDGQGIVVWQGADFDILTNIEQIWFNNGIVEQQADSSFTFTPYGLDTTPGAINQIADVVNENQIITGSTNTDAFVIDGNSTDFGWGATIDGQGIVVWQNNGPNFDILNNVEQIQFNNGIVEQQSDGSFTFTPTATGESGVNTINNDPQTNQNVAGTDRPDIFAINGLSTDYGWGETQDSGGIVVWQGASFDILNNVEQIEFTDGMITQLPNDTFVFASTVEILNRMGTGADETLAGGNANDMINGAGGTDTLTGGVGLDRFMAGDNNGDDIITDFEDGYDLIDFSTHTTVNEFSDLNIAQDGANTRIAFDGGSFTLNNTDEDTLTFSDFIFT